MPCKNIYSLAAVLALSLFCLGMQDAGAETTPTVLYLDRIPSTLQAGERVVFSGSLESRDGRYVITNAVVYIKDDDFGPDDLIARAVTDDNGRFSVSVTAKDWDEYSSSVEIYAVYEGSGDVKKSRSATQNVRVVESRSSDSGGSSYTKQSTRLTMSASAESVYAGNTVIFSGWLVTSDGTGVANKPIKIKEDDPFLPDETLASGRTDSDGYYSIRWVASAGLVETYHDVYATYGGDRYFKGSKTKDQELSVWKRDGSLTLDRIPSRVNVGDIVLFSGRLQLDGHDPTNAVVYIKDEDTGNLDDLLATAFVDRNGKFAASWIARETDPTSWIEVFAVFEETDTHYRLTACGSGCDSTKKLYIREPIVTVSPSYNYEEKEYMNLYYTMSFDDNPRVAIVPSPDSYDAVRGHIVPVQEGIRMWTGMLEHQYGGDWDVDFELVTPDKRFVEKMPDVVINLVTGDDDPDCVDEYLGVALLSNMQRPIQTRVCSDDGKTKRSSSGVASTAAHEFIHAMGLGHTFNRDGDMMCSREDGVLTCPNLYKKSQTPSELNLGAVVALYGRDGFKDPNNFYHLSQFSLDDDRTGADRDMPTLHIGAPPKPKVKGCDGTDKTINWRINAFELKPNWHKWWTICSAGPINYWFHTDNRQDGYRIYVLPSYTDIKGHVYDGNGYYYKCEGHDRSWHKLSATCDIAYGSKIVLHNDESNTIKIHGRIWE